MSDLTEFLLARIAEEEKVALCAMNASGRSPWVAKSFRVVVDDGEFEVAEAAVPTATHIALHDPDHVRDECKAKRRIVTDHGFHESGRETLSIFGERILGILALPYVDHPDWREEWRP